MCVCCCGGNGWRNKSNEIESPAAVSLRIMSRTSAELTPLTQSHGGPAGGI